MVQIVLVYCLVANSNACVEKRPLMEDAPSLSACMFAPQQMAAQFVTEHPEYRLARYRCEVGKRQEKAA